MSIVASGSTDLIKNAQAYADEKEKIIKEVM